MDGGERRARCKKDKHKQKLMRIKEKRGEQSKRSERGKNKAICIFCRMDKYPIYLAHTKTEKINGRAESRKRVQYEYT